MKIQPKRLWQLILFCAALTLLCFVYANFGGATAYAQTGNNVSFALLNVGERTMRGPFDGTQIDFALPADWQLTGGGELHLNFATYLPSWSKQAGGTPTPRSVGGLLNVSFNNILIGTLQLGKDGETSVTLPISSTAWLTATLDNPDARQALNFELNTNEPCGTEPTTVIVHPSSYFLLPHRNIAPVTDLKRLPYPIVQRSFSPDTAVLVMPDRPTVGELQGVLTLAAGLGRMSSGNLNLTYTTAAGLNDNLVKSGHLIFVGKPSSLPQLPQTTLPAPISGQTFSNAEILADDGVLQMAVSPWNAAKVMLLVSGQSDAGVIKASQAAVGGLIRTNNQGNLAIVAQVQSNPAQLVSGQDHPLADLGYGSQTLWGPGLRDVTYYFETPYDQAVAGEAYLDLVFANSALLDYDQSVLNVSLNDNLVGSLRFSDRTTRISSWRLNLPTSAFRPGLNTLYLEANLQPAPVCLNTRDLRLWFNVRPESNLHFTLGPSQSATRRFQLSDFPSPFSPELDRTAFVLAENDPDGWNVAAQLGYELGRRTQGTLISLVAAYANNVPEPIRQQRDLLLVGRASTLPILGELTTAMPGPFDAGSDIANEPGAEIKFRVSKDTPVGYLQLFPAPWNKDRSVLAVLGNSDQGFRWASAALTNPILRAKLSGNFAVINGTQIQMISAPTQANAGATPAAPAAATATSAPTGIPILLGLFIAGGAGILALVVLAIILLRRK